MPNAYTIPQPPNPQEQQYKGNPLAFQRAQYDWMLRVKRVLEKPQPLMSGDATQNVLGVLTLTSNAFESGTFTDLTFTGTSSNLGTIEGGTYGAIVIALGTASNLDLTGTSAINGVLQIGTLGFTSNGTASVSITNVGIGTGTTAHTTIKRWLNYIDSTGTNTGYIPVF